jgi:hypothetical protein
MKTAQHTRPHNTKTGNPTRPLPELLPTLLLALFFMMGGYGEVSGQNAGIFESYIQLNLGGSSQTLSGMCCGTDFGDNNLGAIRQNQEFRLTGASIKTFKNGGADVFGGEMNWRVYRTGSVPGDFNQFGLNFLNDIGGGDQEWGIFDLNPGINLMDFVDRPGEYRIEIWYRASTSEGDRFDSNSGNNYIATIYVEGNRPESNGNWSMVTWSFGDKPGASDFVELVPNREITLDENANVSSILISDQASLTVGNNEILTLSGGSNFNNQGSFMADNGTVSFAGAGSITGTITFNNLEVSGAVDPGSVATVNGTLSLLSGGSLTTNTPSYGLDSILLYNTGTSVSPGTEWPTGDTDNPVNVTLEGTGTQVSFGSDGLSRTIGGNLSIGSGATLQLSSAIGGDLEVAGDWTNAGNFDANNRAVTFNGSATQTLTNNTTSPIVIDFLTNNNSNDGITINSNEIQSIRLTNNGLLNLEGNRFTLKSDTRTSGNVTSVLDNSENATINIDPVPINAALHGEKNQTGEIVIISGGFLLNDGTINGDVTFEQLFSDPGPESTNSNDRWAAFAAPTSNAVYSEGDVDNPSNVDRALLRKIWTQGFPGSNDDRNTSDPSVLVYDPSADGGNGDYVAPSSNEITAGQGFFAFLFERKDRDDDTGGSDVDFTDPFATQGTINPNAFTFSTVEEGFNLLGNPLGVPIDWAATGTDTWTKTSLDEWIWLWDAANNQFEVRSDSDSGLGSAVIAPFQPFMVISNAASPALELGAEARTTASNPNAGLFDGPERPFITLELEAGDKSSKTHFRFGEAYGESFTSKDAPFLTPLATNFAYTYSLKENNAAMLNSLSDDAGSLEIPIAAGAFAQGNFYDGPANFTWPAFEQVPESWDIILQDSFTGAEVNLREDSSYEFVMSPGLNDVQKIESFRDLKREDSPAINPEFSGERFTLIIEQGTSTSTPVNGELPAEIALKQNYPNPFNPATQIAYALPEASEVRLEVFNIQGQRVATLVDGRQNAGTHEVSFDAADLASGVYLYRLSVSGENGRNILTQKMTLLK